MLVHVVGIDIIFTFFALQLVAKKRQGARRNTYDVDVDAAQFRIGTSRWAL